MLPLLRERGFDATIVHALPVPKELPDLAPTLVDDIAAQGCDIVVFQKMHGPSVLAAVRALEARGVRTVYQVCDLVDAAMVEATSATIVVTEFLRSLYPEWLQPRIHVVHDGIEHPEHRRQPPSDAVGIDRPLHAILVTSSALDRLPVIGTPPPWLRVTIVAAYPPRADRASRRRTTRWTLAAQSGWRARLDFLRFATHPQIERESWDAVGVYRHLAAADVGIIPVDERAAVGDDATIGALHVPTWQVKSENRLTLKMALGLPVVATPIPAYLPVVEHGVNGFLARSRDEWLACLQELRDPQRRLEVGAAARASVIKRYSQAEQARLMATLFDRLAASRR